MGSLLTRQDTIVVASVSCIYGLGSPDDYQNMMVPVWVGQKLTREEFLSSLVGMLFERNDIAFGRGKFRVRGDVVEVHPAYLDETAIRIEFFDDEVERITSIHTLTGHAIDRLENHTFFPAKQFVTPGDKMKRAMVSIREEANGQVAKFEKEGKLIEAQRLRMRTDYDLEMMAEMGFCQGIENYSRHITGREPGARPYTLLDFFPRDFLLLVDESHATIPQVGGMYEGDKSRKTVLVDHGFRLPSALDNRPLRFEEFMQMTGQRVYVSATPGPFEIVNSRPENKDFIPVKDRGERPEGGDVRLQEAEGEAQRKRRTGGEFRSLEARHAAGGGADHPADRPARSGADPAAAEGADRRDHRALPPARGAARAGAGDDPHQENRRGSRGVSDRHRAEVPLPALRHRRGGAGGNPAPAAGGDV